MCGIFGSFNAYKKETSRRVINAMGDIISYRGPDDFSVDYSQGAAMGNCRLSIIDIQSGRQPFISDDNQVVLVQNGEIFNYVELAQDLAASGYLCKTRSDTEVLLRLYERDGLKMFEQLNGMFAIAILDKRKNTLVLARDRVGVKPLYFAKHDETYFFASEIKSLLEVGIKRKLNPHILNNFLTFNYVPEPDTMFEGIHQVPSGHYLEMSIEGVTTNQWWNLAEQKPVNMSENDWIAEFNDILEDAVKLRLRAEVPFGAFLSGGVDSSSIVGLMSKQLEAPVKTYSIGFADPRFDESGYANIAAERFQTDHRMHRVESGVFDLWPLATWHCDQPHGDISFIPTYEVSKLAAEDVKVVLTGDGADELFAGYDKYKNFFCQTASDDFGLAEFHQAYYNQLSLFSAKQKSALYSRDLLQQVEGHDPFDMVKPLFAEAQHMDRLNQALYIDTKLLLSGNNLVKPDRMGMANSLEARTPFLDYRMMEFAFRTRGNFKLYNGETKYLYKKAVSPLIGEDLAYRKKQMFTVPVGEWFRKELANHTRNILLSEQAISRELFNPSEITNMLDAHKMGSHNFTREIRALLAIEIWARIFLDGDTPRSAPANFSSIGL